MADFKGPMIQLFVGFLIILTGAILASPLVSGLETVTLGTQYTGASSIRDLIPLIWFIALMASGIGLVVSGFRGIRRGD